MKNILVAILAILPTISFGQEVSPPPDSSGKMHITIFTHEDYSSRPEENMLVSHTKSSVLSNVIGKVHFHHYTNKHPLYAAGRYGEIKESDFPVIMFQRSDGGVVYMAKTGEIPSSPNGLYQALKASYEISKDLETQPEVVYEEPIEGPLLDAWSGRSGSGPVRDTMAKGGWLFTSLVALVVVIIVLMVSSPFIIIFLYITAKVLLGSKK